jgi:hypothetical protein
MDSAVVETALQPVAADLVYMRMCLNLSRQYWQAGERAHQELRLVLDILLTIRPRSREFLFMQARVGTSSYFRTSILCWWIHMAKCAWELCMSVCVRER